MHSFAHYNSIVRNFYTCGFYKNLSLTYLTENLTCSYNV